jgi:hypothetical protein
LPQIPARPDKSSTELVCAVGSNRPCPRLSPTSTADAGATQTRHEIVSSKGVSQCRECWGFVPPSRCACSQRRRPPHSAGQERISVDAAARLSVRNAAATGNIAPPERFALRTAGAASAMAPIRGDARAGPNARQATAAAWETDALRALTIGYATPGLTALAGRSAERAGALGRDDDRACAGGTARRAKSAGEPGAIEGRLNVDVAVFGLRP